MFVLKLILMKQLLLILSLFTILSCSITRTKKVAIDFKKETPQSLKSFLDSKSVQYKANDIAALNHINAWINYNDSGKLSVPEAYFFNRDGYRVNDNFKGTRCGQVINNVSKINAAPVNYNDHIDAWLKDFVFPLGDNNTVENDKYDAYIIITWAKFVDSLSSSNSTAIAWYNSLQNNPDIKIRTIFLNIDLQDKWELNEKQEKALGLSKEE